MAWFPIAYATAGLAALMAAGIWSKGGGLEVVPCSITLKKDGNSLDAVYELKQGDVVTLEGAIDNQRDQDFAPKNHARFITSNTLKFVKHFWDSWSQNKEFCVGGAAGSGKSCAVKILAADLCRKLPKAQVYYFRDVSDVNFVKVQLCKQKAREGIQTFLIVDQVVDDSDAKTLGAFASNPNLWVVLVSSANLPYFHEDREGGQHTKTCYNFPFFSPAVDCLSFANLLHPTVDFGQLKFEPQLPLIFDHALSVVPQPTDVDGYCTWANGHLLTLSGLLQNDNPSAVLNQKVVRMEKFFAEEQDHFPFYLELVKMFKAECTSLSSSNLRPAQLDLRYTDASGHVLCPLFLQAFEQSLLMGRPIPKFYVLTHTDLLNKNPSEIGFGVERECLQNSKLLQSGKACLAKLGQPLFKGDQCIRIGFRNVAEIVDETHAQQSNEWALHAIPLQWNLKSIDGLLLYYVNSTLFVIGNSISVQTAQEHAKSLVWIDKLEELKSELQANNKFPTIQFVLLFTAKQSDSTVKLRVSADMCNKVAKAHLVVMDYPITKVMETTSAFYFQIDLEMKSYGARKLEVVESKKRKASGCGCNAGCKTKKCACKKINAKCAQCSCSNCENK